MMRNYSIAWKGRTNEEGYKMISKEIKMDDEIIGKAFISSSLGTIDEIEIWVPPALVMGALKTACKNITITSE